MSETSRGPVAIVGIGCRFPGGANDPEAFWRLLEEGTDAVARMPAGRFDIDSFIDPTPGTPGKMVTGDGGFLQDIDRFDAAFFGLSPREARKIDPQHRLLLEVAWEALEDAGIAPSSLAGRRVGVYAGVWSGEYENVMYRSPAELDFHSITGGGRYAASGRISFALDLRGPALTVDTGCSASLVALHLARQAIENDEADLAIVAAANLVLQPHVNVGYSRSGMLSAGARCRFGDAAAAGYVRSDGVGAVVLKPARDARRDRDPIRAILAGTAVNADGRGSGQLATPSSDAQAELLETVYGRAGVDPSQVAYVEAHGTGTRAGDPVELEALGRVLGRDRAPGSPLIVGSVKTNIGHTEAAAGMAGLIKTVLALQHRRIPANLHLRSPNEAIAWGDLHVEIPTEARDWPAGAPLVAGVSSFGITGTNAHAVVAGVDGHGGDRDLAADTAEGREHRPPEYVVALSARTPEALTEAAGSLRDWLRAGEDSVRIEDLAYTTTSRREHHEQRLAVVAANVEGVLAGLDEHTGTEAGGRAISGVADVASPPRIGFVFSGQGSQWVGMGRELLETAPAFAETMARCDAVIRDLAGWSVLEVLRDDAAGRLDRVEVIQPTITCMQIALGEQLRAWGIVPDAVVGHSMGEVAAAFSAGALSLEDALRVVVVRSRLLAGIAGQGAMALIDLSEGEVEELLAGRGSQVSVAAINGPRSTVISGVPEVVDDLLEKLDDDGIFCRRVRVDVASHSPQTDPLLGPLREELAAIRPSIPRAAFHSTARPGAPTDTAPGADYWVDNLRHPVRLLSAVRAMIADGIDTFVEIAPHPVLLTSLADIAADAEASIRTVAGPRRDEPEFHHLLQLVSRLHVLGAPVAWPEMAGPGARVISLPHYPWQRERHWLDVWEDWSGDGAGTIAVARPERADEVAYTVQWEPAAATPERSAFSGAWILVGGSPVVRRSAELLGAAGAVPVGAASAREIPDALREAAERGLKVMGVVHLGGIDVNAASGGTQEVLEGTSGEALDAIQSLLSAGLSVPTWWVTRGVQSVPGRAGAESAWPQAGLWGLARTLWQEHPELDAHLVDLDPAASDEQSAEQIVRILGDPAGEPQVAIAGGVEYVARLLAAGRGALATPATWRGDVAHLITGGMGSLGLIVAAEMVRAGARRIVLMSRTKLPPRREWSALPPGTVADRVAGVLQLEAMGASVHLAAVDVGDRAALDAWLVEYRAEQWPAIGSIVHCAGALDNHLLRDLTRSSLLTMIRTKGAAAANLAALLPDVEQTVYFSSTVAVLPQPGQANYAAANATLDALAAARSAAGHATTSLGWGVWKDAGLVADAAVRRYVETMEKGGLESFETSEARDLFHWAAVSTEPHLALVPVDWATARDRLAQRPGAAFYGELIGSEGGSTGGEALRNLLQGAAVGARATLLAEHLRGVVARILDVEPAAVAPGQPLGRQGLDSLMALEFRNRLEGDLQLRLPASLTWNYPTLQRMSEHLLDRLALDGEAPSEDVKEAPVIADANPTGLDPTLRTEIAELTDEEILQQLRMEV